MSAGFFGELLLNELHQSTQRLTENERNHSEGEHVLAAHLRRGIQSEVLEGFFGQGSCRSADDIVLLEGAVIQRVLLVIGFF